MNSEVQDYRGEKVIIRFDGAKCIHSRNCVLGNPHVFVPNAPGAWIQPDAATPEAVVALATACPSGAIAYERLDGSGQEQAPHMNVVRVRENGPLAFQAETEIQEQGNVTAQRYAAVALPKISRFAMVTMVRSILPQPESLPVQIPKHCRNVPVNFLSLH